MVFTLPVTFIAKEGQSLVTYRDINENTTPVVVMLEKYEPTTPQSPKIKVNELLEKKMEVVKQSDYRSKVNILRPKGD